MGAHMAVGFQAVPIGTEPDFAAGRKALANSTAADFDFEDGQLEEYLEELNLDPAAELSDELARAIGDKLISDLEKALDSHDTTTIKIGGYWLYLSGGLTHGEPPTEEAGAMWYADQLPAAVLRAIGFVLDPSQPVSRRNHSKGPVSDTDVVDSLALGLGTKSEWGSDALEWIALAIEQVRPSIDGDPVGYLEAWRAAYGVDPLAVPFLAKYVDDDAVPDDDNEDEADEDGADTECGDQCDVHTAWCGGSCDHSEDHRNACLDLPPEQQAPPQG